MEAARVAALRGHEVTLYEKETKLGGLMPVAAMVKDLELESILDMIRYLKNQITRSGVTTRFGKEVNLSVIEQIETGCAHTGHWWLEYCSRNTRNQ